MSYYIDMVEKTAKQTAEFHQLLQLQDKMNQVVNPDWMIAGYSWYRAAWIEAAELMEHLTWKWWKSQDPCLEQAKLEVVDIFHFLLSDLMDNSPRSPKEVLQCLNDSTGGQPVDLEAGQKLVEKFSEECLQNLSVPLHLFPRLMQAVGMDYEELRERYIHKNVLNIFRQDHGYKEGTYRKIWDGREDNEHLVEIAADVSSDENLYETLYGKLEERYNQLTQEG